MSKMKPSRKIIRNDLSWIKKKLVSLSIIFLSCFIGLLIVEITLRITNSDKKWLITSEANILRNFQYTYNISNLYPSDYPSDVLNVKYARNEFGLRDNCDGPDKIDILTIGGSTTDQRYVNFEFTYQTILQQRLRAVINDFGCVSNSGVDGHSTWGHIFAFENWFPLIPELKPKFILLYVGINDTDFNRTTPHFNYDTKEKNIKNFLKSFNIVEKLLPIYRFFLMQKENKEVFLHASPDYNLNDYTVTSMNKKTIGLSAKNASLFKSRIEILLKKIQALNAIPICVTQPHRFVIKKDNLIYGIPNILGNGFSGIDFDFSLQQLNSILFELCGENTVDLYNHNFLSFHFYDGIHTTDLGSQEIGNKLADFIISRFY